MHFIRRYPIPDKKVNSAREFLEELHRVFSW